MTRKQRYEETEMGTIMYGWTVKEAWNVWDEYTTRALGCPSSSRPYASAPVLDSGAQRDVLGFRRLLGKALMRSVLRRGSLMRCYGLDRYLRGLL